MKVLVFSDSHASLRFMRKCVEQFKPDAVVHLGDYYDDAETLLEMFPHMRLHQVAGNCDKYRAPLDAREMLCYPIGGVMTYMTHGHNQRVKSGIGGLLSEARQYGAKVVLYGHTHAADCHREEDGVWVLNPGSAGHAAGSAGVFETDGQNVTACYLVSQTELEDRL